MKRDQTLELFEMSQAEIAKELGTSQQNVNDALKKAEKKYKKIISEKEAKEFIDYFDEMRRNESYKARNRYYLEITRGN